MRAGTAPISACSVLEIVLVGIFLSLSPKPNVKIHWTLTSLSLASEKCASPSQVASLAHGNFPGNSRYANAISPDAVAAITELAPLRRNVQSRADATSMR